MVSLLSRRDSGAPHARAGSGKAAYFIMIPASIQVRDWDHNSGRVLTGFRFYSKIIEP
jgi:hypothetical protein